MKQNKEGDSSGSLARSMLNRTLFTTTPHRNSQVFKMHSENEDGSDGPTCECSNPNCPCGKKGKS